jgi:ParB-like chromosome segregation protein Spo0J
MTLAGGSYRCDDPAASPVPLEKIQSSCEPMFDVGKAEAIVQAIGAGAALPPVQVDKSFRIRDGEHRTFIATVLGAAFIPCILERTP